ncbi:MAG TPA: hypothetical protein VKA70_04980 [Blastocatellia bacterium]|nr:hypothetical protein [Blastocatellia bacterium]
MSTANTAGNLFERLMALADEAFANKLFSVAYHALAAAYHCAVASNSEHQLSVVERAALEQLRWIDANAPDYEHSTASASKRNHTSIFVILSQQAATRSRYISLGYPSTNK